MHSLVYLLMIMGADTDAIQAKMLKDNIQTVQELCMLHLTDDLTNDEEETCYDLGLLPLR